MNITDQPITTSPFSKSRCEAEFTKQYIKMAKETVTVEIIKGSIYAYGSELACLRIYYGHRFYNDRLDVKYSDNLKTWFFAREHNLDIQN